VSHSIKFCTPAPIELFGGGHDGYEVKFGSIVRRVSKTTELEGLKLAIVGFPTDEGVRRNHGRTGAASGPLSIRRAFYRLNAMDAFRHGIEPDLVGDVGNVEPAADLAESQQRLACVVEILLQHGLDVIVLGGGHETAFGHLAGHIALGTAMTVYNVDPHLDVRNSPGDRPTSGNPFRLAIERAEGRLRYVCLGARTTANAPAYAEYMLEHGADIHWEPVGGNFAAAAAFESSLARDANAHIVLSLDADSVTSAQAPGTSAASPIGITAREFVRCAAIAGGDRRVRALEISECAPPLDRDYQTERLCALAMQAFLMERLG
jgi:formiminoglutamase